MSIRVTNVANARSWQYFKEHTHGRGLMSRFDMARLDDSRSVLQLVSSGGCGPDSDYDAGCGGSMFEKYTWLTEAVLDHLSSDPSNLVLFEDAMVNPGDVYLNGRLRDWANQATAILLTRDHVFWPIFSNSLLPQAVDETLRLSAGGSELIVFCRQPQSLALKKRTHLLTDAELRSIAVTTTVIIIDVFDWEGYLVWRSL